MNLEQMDRAWRPIAAGGAGVLLLAAICVGEWNIGPVRSWMPCFAIPLVVFITGIVAHHMVTGEIRSQEPGTCTSRERRLLLNLSRTLIWLMIVLVVISVALVLLIVLALYELAKSIDEDGSFLFIC